MRPFVRSPTSDFPQVNCEIQKSVKDRSWGQTCSCSSSAAAAAARRGEGFLSVSSALVKTKWQTMRARAKTSSSGSSRKLPPLLLNPPTRCQHRRRTRLHLDLDLEPVGEVWFTATSGSDSNSLCRRSSAVTSADRTRWRVHPCLTPSKGGNDQAK